MSTNPNPNPRDAAEPSHAPHARDHQRSTGLRPAPIAAARVAADAERWLDELERGFAVRSASLEARADEALRAVDQKLGQAEHELSRRERRHELKLVRQERDRRIAAAELRLSEQAKGHAETLERLASRIEQRVGEIAERASERTSDALRVVAESAREELESVARSQRREQVVRDAAAVAERDASERVSAAQRRLFALLERMQAAYRHPAG